MIYKQQAYLPIIFQVDEGSILKVKSYLKRNKLLFSRVLVVSGESYSRKIATQIFRKNNWTSYKVKSNTFQDVNDLKKIVTINHFDLLIGVGGGKVIDVVKRVSYLTNINNLSIPTIISNDGLISPISVIKNDEGRTESLPGMMPMGIIIDLDVIRNSPLRFLKAAIGDVLANLSATNDWILAVQQGKESMNDIAFQMGKNAANSLLYCATIDITSKPFLRLIIQALINSGIAMALSGTSRPCSGSEHQISHAIDYFNCSKNKLHGMQVGTISLFTLFLQGKLTRSHIVAFNAFGICLKFDGIIEDFSKEKFLKIIRKAKEMRPGRYTILDTLSETSIFDQYQNFSKYVDGVVQEIQNNVIK